MFQAIQPCLIVGTQPTGNAPWPYQSVGCTQVATLLNDNQLMAKNGHNTAPAIDANIKVSKVGMEGGDMDSSLSGQFDSFL